MGANSSTLLSIASAGFSPPSSELRLHVDGGLYRLWGRVKNADTGLPVAVYEHLHPFERGFWTRDLAEFELRFSPIDAKEAALVMAVPAQELRAAVNGNKVRRRAQEARAQPPAPAVSRYALGFMFSSDRSRVALIRKLTPAWQAGLLNGIGGKIEPGESPAQAMAREFAEEAGPATDASEWELFARLGDPRFEVHAFRMFSDRVDACESLTAERVEIIQIDADLLLREGISGLPTLVFGALDQDSPFLSLSYREWAERDRSAA